MILNELTIYSILPFIRNKAGESWLLLSTMRALLPANFYKSTCKVSSNKIDFCLKTYPNKWFYKTHKEWTPKSIFTETFSLITSKKYILQNKPYLIFQFKGGFDYLLDSELIFNFDFSWTNPPFEKNIWIYLDPKKFHKFFVSGLVPRLKFHKRFLSYSVIGRTDWFRGSGVFYPLESLISTISLRKFLKEI